MKLSRAGLDLIRRFEGCVLHAYRCQAGVLTVGYGHTSGVKEGQKITQAEADRLLAEDVERYEEGVTDLLLGVPLTQGQFDALVSLSFNVGLTNLANSRLLNRLRKGDVAGAGDEFRRWVHARGVKLPGLVKRREAERSLFLS